MLASDNNSQDTSSAATKQLLARLESLQSRDPANAALAPFAARQYIQQQQWTPAQQALEPLLGESPSAEVYQLLMSCYRQQQLTGPLVALLGQAVDTTGSLVVFGDELQKLTADEFLPKLMEEAHKRKNDRRRPMIAGESMAVALLLLEAKQFDATDDFFRYALEKTLDPDEALGLKLLWAEECFFADDNPPAVKYFAEILAEPNENINLTSVTELLTMAYEYEGQTEQALQTIDAAIEAQPDSPQLAARKAWVLYHAERKNEARQAYADVIQQFGHDYSSESTRETVRDARMILSNLHVESRQIQPAAELLLEVLDEYPEDAGAMNDLGYLWADESQHLERASTMVQAAVAAEPDNPAYLDSLGWVYFRMNQAEKALAPLKKAVANMEEPDGIILDHLGDVYHALGQVDQARESWQQAADLLRASDQLDHADTVQKKLNP